MNTAANTEKRFFPIAIRTNPDEEPHVVDTIEVDVILCNGEEFLTPESSERIERERAHHLGLLTGEDIKAIRERYSISQKEFTRLLQCGEKSLSRWENGRGQPTGLVNTMLRLLDEGFVDLHCLRAVQGPRTGRWTPRNVLPFQARKGRTPITSPFERSTDHQLRQSFETEDLALAG
jgi:DNA-binding transcriptional regulator YiaG